MADRLTVKVVFVKGAGSPRSGGPRPNARHRRGRARRDGGRDSDHQHRPQADLRFDMVGTKRLRTMANGLACLDAAPPRDFDDRPDIANYAAITALDYILFGFPDRDRLGGLADLAAWHTRQNDRPSVRQPAPSA